MHARMVSIHKGMTNWYRNPHGRVFAITPWRAGRSLEDDVTLQFDRI